MLKPVRKQSVSDAVFEQLRDRIISGDIAPGSQLPGERALSVTLGVNRGAIREALKRLAQVGLVSIHHGGGTRVLNFRASATLDLLAQIVTTPEGFLDLKVARSIVELRYSIVPHVTRLAARRATPERVREIGVKLEELRAAAAQEQIGALQELRWEFWALLTEASDNIAYQLAFNTIRKTYDPVRSVMADALGPLLMEIDGFARIVEAVRRRDADGAELAARELVDALTDKLLKAIEEAESSGQIPVANANA